MIDLDTCSAGVLCRIASGIGRAQNRLGVRCNARRLFLWTPSQQQCEFIASHSCGRIVSSHVLAQYAGHTLQDFIAPCMPASIVHALEIIQVDKQQRIGFLTLLALLATDSSRRLNSPWFTRFTRES
jgi:hypothetical protein